MPETPSTADVVVVGAGSAGSVVARRLVDAGMRVVVIEAGAADTNPAIHDTTRSFELLGSPDDWAYSTVAQPGYDGRTIAFPRGKVLGGSSSINGMIHARGHRSDFDTWAYLGNAGWGWDDVLPLFKRSEDFDGGASATRGAGGPLHVRSDYEPHPTIAAMVRAAEEAGLKRNPDYNDGQELDGVAFIQLDVKDGERHNVARAFLHPVGGALNLTVLTGCQVRRLLFEGTRCVGVELVRDGTVEQVRAEQEVVVCAGAIDSPKLLQLSGIGPADELARLGIDALADLPVGEHLQDHPFSALVYAASQPVPPAVAGLQQCHAHAFWRTRPGLLGPDIQSLFVHLPHYPEGHTGPADGFTFTSMLVRPVSTGSVRLVSSDPTAAPLIDPGYLRCAADVDALAAGLERCREMGQATALDDWREAELFPGPDVRTREELRAYVRWSGATIYHPVGTCRMGVDETAVVDPELRVLGIDGLRVADASIMPLITSANTHAPTVMIGERAADLVLGRPVI